jgi:hypothetical protein
VFIHKIPQKQVQEIFRVVLFSFFVTALLLNAGTLNASPGNASIQNAMLDRTVITPGDEVVLSFRLSDTARITILVYDADYSVVRRLLNGDTRPAGNNSVTWDGRDDYGVMVPNEAYVFSIVAEDSNGKQTVFDPTVSTGGEVLDVPVTKIEESSGQNRIHYELSSPSRISIKAGIHNGPLLRTILDSIPLPAGKYVQAWDGLDETGRISVLRDKGSTLFIKGYLLPECTVIMQKSRNDYPEYQKRLAAAAVSKDAVITQQSIRKSALQRASNRIASQYLVRQTLNVAPKFAVYLKDNTKTGLAENAVTKMSGDVDLLVDVAPESLPQFNESRYEIVVFVDNQRFDEEEQAYPTYLYKLDTRKLANGEHRITVNMYSMAGQIGTYSFTISVNN